MALPFPSFHHWLWKSPSPNLNPGPNPNPPANSFPSTNGNSNYPVSSADSFAALDVDAFQRRTSPRERNSSTRKVCGNAQGKIQKGRQRRRNQSLDLDFDMVIVQPDYVSGSESEGSDWSVGWFEPHAPEFCSDGEPENSFAVLVPCYGSPSTEGRARFGQEGSLNANSPNHSRSQLWAAVLSNITKDAHADANYYLQQWVSALQPQ
ncbi:hypothetical protein KP509_05G011600 [Ceratopteris richardii]|uniref:Uncharacterized protein n=1 Tax=Ceratopteris richardii TaxID=49495 RepID=A0A8T2UQX2_CERRI|nr:hypothetical protein KP509_05G011600 [Ceratopteris richardii]